MRRLRSVLSAGAVGFLFLALALAAGPAAAEPPEYPRKTDGKRPALLERLKSEVPPLKHPRGGRWPMILWECVSFEPQPAEVYKALLDRGRKVAILSRGYKSKAPPLWRKCCRWRPKPIRMRSSTSSVRMMMSSWRS